MPYITLVMSYDTVEDPGYLRFRIGGLSQSHLKASGPLQPLFEGAKVTDFIGSLTVWIRLGNLGNDRAPSLIGIRQEPAIEAIVPFLNQFEEWGYIMLNNAPQVSNYGTRIIESPTKMDRRDSVIGNTSGATYTWIFYKSKQVRSQIQNSYPSPPPLPATQYDKDSYGQSATVPRKSIKTPSPDY